MGEVLGCVWCFEDRDNEETYDYRESAIAYCPEAYETESLIDIEAREYQRNVLDQELRRWR
jgi:hypothetical protein